MNLKVFLPVLFCLMFSVKSEAQYGRTMNLANGYAAWLECCEAYIFGTGISINCGMTGASGVHTSGRNQNPNSSYYCSYHIYLEIKCTFKILGNDISTYTRHNYYASQLCI